MSRPEGWTPHHSLEYAHRIGVLSLSEYLSMKYPKPKEYLDNDTWEPPIF